MPHDGNPKAAFPRLVPIPVSGLRSLHRASETQARSSAEYNAPSSAPNNLPTPTPPTQSELQAVKDKLKKLINAMGR
jgi:hypothetical protein